MTKFPVWPSVRQPCVSSLYVYGFSAFVSFRCKIQQVKII